MMPAAPGGGRRFPGQTPVAAEYGGGANADLPGRPRRDLLVHIVADGDPGHQRRTADAARAIPVIAPGNGHDLGLAVEAEEFRPGMDPQESFDGRRGVHPAGQAQARRIIFPFFRRIEERAQHGGKGPEKGATGCGDDTEDGGRVESRHKDVPAAGQHRRQGHGHPADMEEGQETYIGVPVVEAEQMGQLHRRCHEVVLTQDTSPGFAAHRRRMNDQERIGTAPGDGRQ